MEVWKSQTFVVDDVLWFGFAVDPGRNAPRVKIDRVVVEVDDQWFRDADLVSADVRRASPCHYIVPSRPALREGRFVTYQCRDDRIPVRQPGEIVVLVGLVGGAIDHGAAVTLRDLLRDYVLPRHGLRFSDVACRDDVREVLLPSEHG